MEASKEMTLEDAKTTEDVEKLQDCVRQLLSICAA
jgi:hypothetical protein